MFLNKLNLEEKIAFLELAHHVARCNGDFSRYEKTIIETYCFEMQIDDIVYDKTRFNIKKVLSVFESKMSQKVLLLELMALIYSDNILDSKEQDIIDLVARTFDVSKSLVGICAEWTKSILAISAQGELLLEI